MQRTIVYWQRTGQDSFTPTRPSVMARCGVVETNLEMARRHVAEQETRITRQKALIQRLEDGRVPTNRAEELLASMIDFLAILRGDLNRFSN